MELFRQPAKDNEVVMAFVPARVAHRHQFQTDTNRQLNSFSQNEQQIQESPRKFLYYT